MKNSASGKSFLNCEGILNNISKKHSGVSSTTDMRRLVELINTTDDIELLVKLFTVLAVYLVSNDTYKGDIITSNNIYDKLRNVLSNGQPLKTVRTLNFITALLYQNEEEEGPSRARTLVLYAQNMIRINGCLSLMCNMFTSCMLHQETWRALCQCLAESCRKCTENQSYCSHLVPMAVRKCAQGNVEAMEILKCLLYNHENNVQLFVESNGITMFSRRETLLNEPSMQLLSSLVQNSTPEILSTIYETVFQNLSHLKHLYGTQNKIGQWATIIWHHLSSRIKVTKAFDVAVNNNKKDVNINNSNETVNESSMIDIRFLKPDDTARLLQNVIREIHQYNAKNSAFQNTGRQTIELRNTDPNNDVNKNQLTPNKKFVIETNTNTSRKLDPAKNEMSFSFLLKKQPDSKTKKHLKKNKTPGSQLTGNSTKTHFSNCVQMETKTTEITNIRFSRRDTTFLSGVSAFNNDDPSLLEFNPVYVSTPKKNKRNNKLNNLPKSSPRSRQNTINKMRKIADKTIKAARCCNDRVNLRRDFKNRSMTSRLYHAINDSCTTFVKSVKNIFKSKKNDDVVKNQSASNPASNRNSVEPSFSYSFTDYMRKRDALLSNETGLEGRHNFGEVRETENIFFCKTCNDTVSLKYKVNNDHYLKETVTKLKLGINLYGCDFKKISKAMWPRETYMTPEVLYNLYRKLIIK